MTASRVVIVLALFLLPSVSLGQEPVRSKEWSETSVPILSDLPIVGNMFRRAPRVRIPLPQGEAQAYATEGGLTFFERWLPATLTKRFPELSAVEIVKESVARIRDGKTLTSFSVGIELEGPSAALPAAQDFVSRVVAQQGRVLDVRAKFIIVPSETGEARTPEIRVRLLDSAELEAEDLRLQRLEGMEVIAAPQIGLLNLQRASLNVTNELSYIKDYTRETIGEQIIVDPVIDVVREGIALEITPIIHEDGQSISLDAQAWISTLKRPMRTFSTTLAAGQTVTFQVPEKASSTWKSEDLTLGAKDRGFLVEGLSFMDKDFAGKPRPVVLLVSVSIVEEGGSRPALGTLLVVDRTAGQAVARLTPTEGSDAALPGRQVVATRDGVSVASLEVSQVDGALAVLRILSGAPMAGDALK
jgi:hypothetical protein